MCSHFSSSAGAGEFKSKRRFVSKDEIGVKQQTQLVVAIGSAEEEDSHSIFFNCLEFQNRRRSLTFDSLFFSGTHQHYSSPLLDSDRNEFTLDPLPSEVVPDIVCRTSSRGHGELSLNFNASPLRCCEKYLRLRRLQNSP